ncbi:hypothetical protein BDV10DRAFT_185609 [Aspergillus recurvatus]
MTKFPDAECEPYRASLGEIRRWVRGQHTKPQTQVPLAALDAEILQSLYALGRKGDLIRRLEEPLEGTCEWLLVHPQYQRRIQSSQSEFLWISADPGCGKSHLALYVARQLEKEQSFFRGHVVCSFLFQHDDEVWSMATVALCDLLHQLLSSNPILIAHAVPEYKAKGDKLHNDLSAPWAIFTAVVGDGRCGPVICVSNALDECSDPSRALLI